MKAEMKKRRGKEKTSKRGEKWKEKEKGTAPKNMLGHGATRSHSGDGREPKDSNTVGRPRVRLFGCSASSHQHTGNP